MLDYLSVDGDPFPLLTVEVECHKHVEGPGSLRDDLVALALKPEGADMLGVVLETAQN
ncbi:MAG TPA: hypothetical protein VEQ11_06800 [Chloroflexota bacterium]|nr:hypothetical protein [Chloroflexota bacterium]